MATATQTISARKQIKQRPKIQYGEVARSLLKEYSQDDCSGLAAESAYHILFSIFPLAIFSAAMSGIINRVFGLDLFGKIMASLETTLPPDARNAIAQPLASVLNNQNGGLLSIGIVVALWSGSNAISTFIKGLNRAYDVEETRKVWVAKGIQVALTLFMGLLIASAFILITFGGKLGAIIAGHLGLGPVFNIFWNLFRWLIVVAFISFALAVLYWAGPNIKQEFKWISPGAVLATVIWVLAIYGFGFYVSKFGNYDKTYGTLGGVIILMLVFYYSSLVILIGAELNAELGKRYDPETIADIAAHPEKDKGETIYADKAPNKKPDERVSDLKGAEVRGEPITNRTAPTAKNEHGKQRMVNYSSGKREEPSPPSPDDKFRMTADPGAMRGTNRVSSEAPTKRAAIGVGLLGLSAIGMAAKRMLGK